MTRIPITCGPEEPQKNKHFELGTDHYLLNHSMHLTAGNRKMQLVVHVFQRLSLLWLVFQATFFLVVKAKTLITTGLAGVWSWISTYPSVSNCVGDLEKHLIDKDFTHKHKFHDFCKVIAYLAQLYPLITSVPYDSKVYCIG